MDAVVGRPHGWPRERQLPFLIKPIRVTESGGDRHIRVVRVGGNALGTAVGGRGRRLRRTNSVSAETVAQLMRARAISTSIALTITYRSSDGGDSGRDLCGRGAILKTARGRESPCADVDRVAGPAHARSRQLVAWMASSMMSTTALGRVMSPK